MGDVNQGGPQPEPQPEVIIAGPRSFLPSFFKKPLFFIPAILIILILAPLTLVYFYSPQIPTKAKALNPEEPILLPTSSPIQSVSYQIKAKEILTKLLPIIFTPSLIPLPVSGLNLTQDKTNPESFLVSWETKEASIGGRLAVGNDGKNISSFYLSVLAQPGITLSVDSARTTAAQFFLVEAKGAWKCGILKNQQYCENFWEEGNIKKGLGIYGSIPLANNRKFVSVFFCEYQQDAKVYPWQICTPELTKTGVK